MTNDHKQIQRAVRKWTEMQELHEEVKKNVELSL
jgi:hypothetical protein